MQGLPDAEHAAKKYGIKIIYGMEAYFVNDSSKSIYGDRITKFDEEFCVFDLETTGLDVMSNGITEIGAVKIINGKIRSSVNS